MSAFGSLLCANFISLFAKEDVSRKPFRNTKAHFHPKELELRLLPVSSLNLSHVLWCLQGIKGLSQRNEAMAYSSSVL